LGSLLLAQKYGIPSPTPIKHWVRAYKAFGEEGFRLKDIFKQVDIPEATYHYHIKQ